MPKNTLSAKAQARFVSEQDVRAKYGRAMEKWPEANAVHLAAVLSRFRPDLPTHIVAIDAAKLFGLGKQISTLAVADCNYGLTDRQTTRRENLAALCGTIAGWYGLKAETGGDPRGYVLRLHGRDLPKNGWGDGFGVA